MIKNIGCDIVDHRVTDELKWNSDLNVLNRVFSKDELELYKKEKRDHFLSGRFAAKEAILKCLGTGILDGMSLSEIEILQLDSGQPIVHLEGAPKILSEKLGINYWHVSISHSNCCSIACVIAEG